MFKFNKLPLIMQDSWETIFSGKYCGSHGKAIDVKQEKMIRLPFTGVIAIDHFPLPLPSQTFCHQMYPLLPFCPTINYFRVMSSAFRLTSGREPSASLSCTYDALPLPSILCATILSVERSWRDLE